MSNTTKPQDIEALISLFANSNWAEMTLETGDLSLFLSVDPNAQRAPAKGAAPAPAPAAAVAAPAAQSAPSAAPARQDSGGATPDHWVAVKAPNLGTFYRAPKPGAAPFVNLGDKVDAETEICLIEVMKLFTSVKAGTAGTIRKVCAIDAELVEGEQVLFYIEPA